MEINRNNPEFMKLAMETAPPTAFKRPVGRPPKQRETIDNSSWTKPFIPRGRPREYNGKRVHLLVRVDPECYERIRQEAIRQQRSISNMANMALWDAFPPPPNLEPDH